jgi:hypothetical protein
MNSGSACYLSVQNLLSPKNLKIYDFLILYECETWFLTLREEYKVRVFEKTVMRKIFGLKRMK